MAGQSVHVRRIIFATTTIRFGGVSLVTSLFIVFIPAELLGTTLSTWTQRQSWRRSQQARSWEQRQRDQSKKKHHTPSPAHFQLSLICVPICVCMCAYVCDNSLYVCVFLVFKSFIQMLDYL